MFSQASVYWLLIYHGILIHQNNFKMAYYAGYPIFVVIIQFIQLYIFSSKKPVGNIMHIELICSPLFLEFKIQICKSKSKRNTRTW